MVAISRRDTGDSASSLSPWLIGSLLVHAALLGPSAAPPAPSPERPAVSLQLRLLPAAVSVRSAESSAAARLPGRTTGARPPSRTLPAATAAAPALALPPSAIWHYRLRWRGEDGKAHLSWQQDGERYRLRLERRGATRDLPTWHSEGRLDADAGLLPQAFSTASERGERRLPLPDAQSQDRLSWMLQAAALAARRGLRVGDRLMLRVAGWRGGAQDWLLLAEHDVEAPGLLRLRRLPPEGGALEQLLWLDPSDHYRPVRLRLRYDEAERWELIAADAPPSH